MLFSKVSLAACFMVCEHWSSVFEEYWHFLGQQMTMLENMQVPLIAWPKFVHHTKTAKLFLVCWCPSDWAHKWKSIVTCNKPFNCSFKIILTVPAVSVPVLLLCIAKFIKELSGAAHTQTWQKLDNLYVMQRTD